MRGFVIDMDGVLYHMQRVIPGALDFIAWLQRHDKKFLFLTNSSERSPRELQEKLQRMGITVGSQHFYTSALATASFLQRQKANGTAYVIGEPGLISALYDVGYSMNDSNPDYVVVGETRHYSYAAMELAVKLVRKGARLIGTNCDITDRSQDSFVPACGALVKPIEMASGSATSATAMYEVWSGDAHAGSQSSLTESAPRFVVLWQPTSLLHRQGDSVTNSAHPRVRLQSRR